MTRRERQAQRLGSEDRKRRFQTKEFFRTFGTVGTKQPIRGVISDEQIEKNATKIF